MKSTILTIAAAATTALTVFGSPAEAGGKGVRLQFGGHLGSFVARPTGSRVSKRSSHAYSAAAVRRAKIAKIRKAKIAAARKAKIAQIRKAKIAAAKRARIAVIKKATAAKKRRIAALNRTAKLRASQQRSKEEDVSEQDVKEDVVQDAEVAGVEEIAPATKAKADLTGDTVEAELPEVIVEGDAAETNVADASSNVPPTPEASPKREITCKKFIPSAGLTITVPCQD